MGERVPVDEYGMPYLLHPYEPPRGQTRRWDDDHSFFFSSSLELTDQAGKALRYSRVQRVPRWLHDRKHNIHYPEGVEWLPTTKQDKFALVILSCAGYASPWAIDARGDKPRLVRMSRRTHEFVQGRRQLHQERRRDPDLECWNETRTRRSIGLFIAEYVKEQDIGDVDEATVDMFLNSPNKKVRRRMGNVILGHAIEVAIDPLQPIYRQALADNLLRSSEVHPMRIVKQMFPQEKWPDYHIAFKEQLAA